MDIGKLIFNVAILFIMMLPGVILKKKGMIDQCLVKSTLKDNVLDVLEKIAPDIPFLPIVSETHPRHEELMERNINYIGAIFSIFALRSNANTLK